jgi:TRAP-type C4-dicarboxylate transport system substrate-binding protein
MRRAVLGFTERAVLANEAARWRTSAVVLLAATAIATIFFSFAAAAEPITLKLSFFTSDRSSIYQCYVKPFVEAVDAKGQGLVQIKVYFSGAISPALTEQARLVLDGAADLAWVVPGYAPKQFPDVSVMELPGLFRSERESSLIFARLADAGAFEGYQKFFVVGAFDSAGVSIHSRKPIARLSDLKGQTIRVNNSIAGSTMRKLGAVPVRLPVNQTMDALSQGKIDGVAVPPRLLLEFGFGRLATHHYLLKLGGAPVTLVMSREKFSGLPPRVQEIIREYSGDWLSERGAACFDAKNRETVAQLKADARRTVVEPSSADVAAADRVFQSVTEEWAAQSPRNRELLALARAEIAKLRSQNETRP